MAWITTDDAREFLAAAGPRLRANAASNTVLLTVAASVADSGPALYGDEPPLFGWWAGTVGRVDGAFIHTPPYSVLLSAVPTAAIDPLAELLARDDRRLVGVSATDQLAEAFAAAWSARRHSTTEVALRLRLYRLATPREPDPSAPGSADVATVADEAVVREWMEAFECETGEPPGVSRRLDKHLAAGSLTIWRDSRGTPVALAGYSREVDGARRIGPVYTVKQHRRHGYGAAVTGAASRRALDSGTAQLLLYADIDNPTSNTLYQRLGFEPIESRTTLHFKPRS